LSSFGLRLRRCCGCAFLLFAFHRRDRFGLAGLGQAKLLVLDAASLQQARNGLRRDRAGVQPVLAAIQLRNELLGLAFKRKKAPCERPILFNRNLTAIQLLSVCLSMCRIGKYSDGRRIGKTG
jgi:hypothetical protein